MSYILPAPLHEFCRSHKGLIRFGLLLAVLIGYFGFLWWKYDIVTGGVVAGLTWSFFVLCTPIADAGFLLDFPVRLITGLRMLYSEIGVWTIAISLNTATLHFAPEEYEKTGLTHLFHTILTTPWPYWSIIVLCALGTFLSVGIGDAVMNKVGDKQKDKPCKKADKPSGQGIGKKAVAVWGATALLYGGIVFLYYELLRDLNIDPATVAG